MNIERALYFQSESEIASELGISVNSLKRKCRSAGVSHWSLTGHLQNSTAQHLAKRANPSTEAALAPTSSSSSSLSTTQQIETFGASSSGGPRDTPGQEELFPSVAKRVVQEKKHDRAGLVELETAETEDEYEEDEDEDEDEDGDSTSSDSETEDACLESLEKQQLQQRKILPNCCSSCKEQILKERALVEKQGTKVFTTDIAAEIPRASQCLCQHVSSQTRNRVIAFIESRRKREALKKLFESTVPAKVEDVSSVPELPEMVVLPNEVKPLMLPRWWFKSVDACS